MTLPKFLGGVDLGHFWGGSRLNVFADPCLVGHSLTYLRLYLQSIRINCQEKLANRY